MRPIDADVLVNELCKLQYTQKNPSFILTLAGQEIFNSGIDMAMQITLGSPTLSLNTLRNAIYEDAVAHGLWDDIDDDIPAQVHVVVEEVKELIDAAADLSAAKYRGEDLEQYRQHFIEELADVVISSLSLAGKQEIDIDAGVRRKMAINKTRPWRHGRKNEEDC